MAYVFRKSVVLQPEPGRERGQLLVRPGGGEGTEVKISGTEVEIRRAEVKIEVAQRSPKSMYLIPYEILHRLY